jgi:hypothetical protein
MPPHLCKDLGNIEVTERTEQHMALDLAFLCTQEAASNNKNRLDGSQAPVIVLLWGQNILQQEV